MIYYTTSTKPGIIPNPRPAERRCSHCGATFTVHGDRQRRYCSAECKAWAVARNTVRAQANAKRRKAAARKAAMG